MKITNIISQKKNKNRYSIYIDEKYAFSLDYDTLIRSNLHINDEIEEKAVEKLIKKDEFARARNYAYLLISYRDRSEFELKKRLVDKGFNREVAREVLDFLKNQNLVDDKMYVNKYLDEVLTGKPMGKMRVLYELKSKRIREETIKNVLDKKLGIEIEKKLAEKAAYKKMKVLKDYPPETAKRRLFNHLKNRGFQYDIINEVMKGFLSDNI